MRRAVVSELVHRRSRTLALLVGILVATAAFTVLTGTSETQRLEARGTVERSFRGDYDVLVRPRGSRSAIERRSGQAPPNFLSQLYEGITHDQWRRIQRLPGVDVAAPIANVGYVFPEARVPVDVSEAAGTSGRVLLRARLAWRSERGLTRATDRPSYVYVTPNRLRDELFWVDPEREGGYYLKASLREDVPGRRRPVPVCFSGWVDQPETVIYGPLAARWRTSVGCFSRATGKGRVGYWPLRRSAPRIDVRWSVPMLLTAIDPESEARLTGLDRALVGGRYLRRGDRARLTREPRVADDYPPRVLPVLAASRTYVDERVELAVERLGAAAADRCARPFETHEDVDTLRPLRFLKRQPHGPVVQRATVSAATTHRRLLRQLGAPLRRGLDPNWQAKNVIVVRRVDPALYAAGADPLAPLARIWDKVDWPGASAAVQWQRVTPAIRDASLREVSVFHAGPSSVRTSPPFLQAVGTFDPDRLGATPEPGATPLSTMQPPLLTARDDRTAARLGGRPLLANGNLAGYMMQPPALITTLAGARAFHEDVFKGLRPVHGISAIRVRVAGVSGIDAVSRERIRQAAKRIATATGLDVTITAGASGAPTAVDLPPGPLGRPRLTVTETWVRPGVAARVLSAVDRKSLLLFALILVVCALFVTNAASAAVRARRDELGVLACLGWSTGRLFAVVLAEVALIGLAAGVLGGLVALPLAAAVGVDASPAGALLAVPAATGLALLAGLVPAARAARAQPIAAVRPAVLEVRRAWRPHGLGGLALVNLVRTPGRTALGALSLAIGVCALTLLLAATIAFHDVLVGTLLGDAVAVEVRGTDYVAVVTTVLLGVAAVADVLFLGLRERAAERATLEAGGWDDRTLGRLIAYEGLWIGAIGALGGAAAGLAGAALFAGAIPAALLITSLAAAAAGVLLAGLAALLPALWLRRTPIVPLLAGE